jgi:tetratricopeptide (TPR) repeat protein
MSGCSTRREAREEDRAGPAGPERSRRGPHDSPARRRPRRVFGAYRGRRLFGPRRTVRLAVVVMLIVSQVSFSFGQRGGAPAGARVEYTGMIASVAGVTTIRLTGGGGDFKPAVIRQKLVAGDVVQTGENGHAILVFVDGSRYTLKPKTKVIVSAVREGARRIKLEAGGLYARMARQKGRDTAIETAAAVAGVRGTEFELDVDEAGKTTLTVVEGAVEFKNEKGAVMVGANQQSVARPNEAPTPPVVVDPSGIVAWEATVESLVIPIEDPLVGGQPAELERGLRQRQDAVNANPNDADAQTRLGDVLQDLGRLADAATAYERALAIQPNHHAAREHLALLRLREGRLQEAAEGFNQTLAAAPEAPEGVLGIGLVRLAEGDGARAVTQLEHAATLSADNPRPATFLGVARLRQGQVAAAEASFRRAITARPDYYPAQAYLSYALTVRGDVKGAQAAAQRAVDMAPASPLAREALANAEFYAGKQGEARKEIERVLGDNPLSASAHLLDAKILVAMNRLPEGIEAAQRAVGLDPESAVAHSTLGVLYLADKDRDHAEREFRHALKLSPGLSMARTGLGAVLAQRGDFARAMNENQAALALDSGSAAVHNNIGSIYLSEGKLDAAVAEFEAAIERQPEWGLPYGNLALAYLEEQRYKQAVDAGEQAVKLGERSAPLHTTLARIYQRLNRQDRALTELREAVALDPDYAQAFFQYSQALVARVEDRDATRSLLRGAILDPGAITDSRLYARTDTTLAGGSLGTQQYDGRTSGIGRGGDLSYFMSGLHEKDDGFRQTNSDVRNDFLQGIPGLQGGADHRWLLYGTHFDQDGGRPGREVGGHVDDPNYRSDFSGEEAHLLNRLSTGHYSNLTLKLGVRNRQLNDLNPDSLQGLPTDVPIDPKPFQRLETSVGQILGEGRWDARMSGRDWLTIGASVSQENRKTRGLLGMIEQTDAGPIFKRQWVEDRQSPFTTTLYAEWRRAFGKRFTLTLGDYYGKQSGIGSINRPKLVAQYRPDATSNLVFLAYPTFRSDVSELSPVELWAQPFGFDQLSLVEDGSAMSYELHYIRPASDSSVLSLSAFRRSVRGLLIDLEDPQLAPSASRLPVRRASIDGAQVAYERWLTHSLTGRVWARFQSTSDASAGELPYFPDWQGGFRFDYLDRSGWRAGLDTTWVGSRFADSENTRRVSSFLLVGLRLEKQLTLRNSLFIQINNLFNRSYARYEGYPEAGRTIIGGLGWRF